MHPPIVSTAPQPLKPQGFALVIALSLMAFVLLLLLSITTLVQVETQAASIASVRVEAEQAALFGLQIALGELQKAAGPDQRVTATADIIDNTSNLYTGGTSVPTGQRSWTGVWKSNTVAASGATEAPYTPADPNTRRFVGWLVSATDSAGNFALPVALSDIATSVNTTPATNGVENYVSLFEQSDGTPYTQVEKVRVDSGSTGDAYFAFHVEDESVKANMSWSEIPATGAGPLAQARAQARRLSAAPGPDFGALNGVDANGPFGSVTYPLTIDSSTILADIAKIQSPSDITATGNASDANAWLKDTRADVTWGSRGVLADVKWGGLRRDLSLAFEMDGDKDVTASEQPTLFNAQEGEFVGGNDRLTAAQAALGMGGVKERFVYRDFQGSGTPFASDIFRADAVIRGPNWWSLRDYANLYKRLEGTSGDYSLQARSYYPNRSAAATDPKSFNYSYTNMLGPNSLANIYDYNFVFNYSGGIPDYLFPPDKYLYRPARANYAPILLGAACLFSATAENFNSVDNTAELALAVDPFFYLWNPYNRTLKVDKFAVTSELGLPGNITFWVERTVSGVATTQQYGPARTLDYFAYEAADGATASIRPLTYLLSDLELAPGEIMIVSPSSSRSPTASEMNDELYPGTNLDDLSGVIMNRIPQIGTDDLGLPRAVAGGSEIVTLNLGDLLTGQVADKVFFSYVNNLGGLGSGPLTGGAFNSYYFWLSTSLPPAGTNAEDLADSPPGYTGLYFSSYGDAIQAIQTLTFGDNTRVPEHYDPGQNTMILKTADGVGEAMASDLIDSAGSSKDFFGMVNYLAKPANHQGTHPNPVEVFTQFSPISLNSLSEMSRPCTLNQIFSMIGRDLEVEQFLNQSGIDFPASSAERGWWGASYNSGSTAFPLSSIPSSPLFSLAQFSHASLGVMASEPSRAVGNSWANLFLSPVSTYGRLTNSISAPSSTAADTGWLLNDALFDRYYLSGLAPDFNITSTGYSQTAPMADTLDSFFSADYTTAQANPVLRPYLPEGTSAAQAVTALAATDGYLKTGAYSLIDGAFNVNSTSVAAWQALLSANRDLAVTYANGVSDGGSNGTPFPNSTSPAATGGGAASGWAGLTRITNAQIITLAQKIVDEVKLRGPFMSLSDFINHRVGLPKNNATHYRGALQTAIDAAGINANVHNTAGGVTPDYANMSAYMPDVDPDHINRKSTTGIATDITQADLLLSLAPRLTARSDTFRIRSYGEIRSPLGGGIVSKVVGEAVVQRLPEYVDAVSNQPWDEATGNPLIGNASGLSAINQTFGRRFKVVSFRWLTAEEI